MRGAIALLAGLALAAPALAAPPAVTASASSGSGVAPLGVTLTATGDAAEYSWSLGDGATAEGAVVRHVYGPGRHVATVTAAGPSGETAQAQVVLTVAERRLTLAAPAAGSFGGMTTLAGKVAPVPATRRVQIYRGGIHVSTARVRPDGSFRASIRLRSPGPYHARYGPARSPERLVRLAPVLRAPLATTAPVGSKLVVRPRLEPAGAGTVVVRVDGRRATGPAVRIPTGKPGPVRVEIVSQARPGFAAVREVTTVQVVHPSVARGSRGPSVLALERRLAELRYALRNVDDVYGHDTYEAVLAFQKVHRLPRTGRVDPSLWQRLAAAEVPTALRAGDYIEVDKTRQVLYVVRGGEVQKVVHVSTGATGNTPLGSWQVYRKVGGWDWVLWYPMYFLRGFAIHGYPEVPAHPASHGCVRIPMWIAPSLFESHGHGTTIVIHL